MKRSLLRGLAAGALLIRPAFTLPAQMAVNNKLKPGCAEPAVVGGFADLEKQYLPVWKAAASGR